MHRIETALISVSDKAGLVEFAKILEKHGVKIISSGGTYTTLSLAGINTIKVEDFTGFPEMLDGRVKTLHPKIHAGILAKRTSEHLAQLSKHGFEKIDLVVVNLYPFKQVVSSEKSSIEEAIENIDIGGPALIRAAAKNHKNVGIIVEPSQYKKVVEDLEKNNGCISDSLKKSLMVDAYRHTAFYDSIISSYFAEKYGVGSFSEKIVFGYEKVSELRYGENPHQKAAVYSKPAYFGINISNAKQLNGKELSFNNYLDINSALQAILEFSEPSVVIVKHGNPCGVASAEKIDEAFSKAYACDPLSAFGGIIALNRECDKAVAEKIVSFFNEVVVAPGYSDEALEILKSKKNLRVLQIGVVAKTEKEDFRQIEGGLLLQEKDVLGKFELDNKTGIKISSEIISDLEFAWKVVKNVKSNAIVVAKSKATVGIGGGLTSRVDATDLALKKAGERAKGAVLASDAFFPFKDSVEIAEKAGIVAIVEPGGSINDEQVIDVAKKAKIALYFTGERHFKH
jgi:phosphoribosylaminoimidazolecarboxamide formyltransferase/IMP cyclohydrolase